MSDEFDYVKTVKEAIVTTLVEHSIKIFLGFFEKTDPPNQVTNIIPSFEEKILLHFNELFNWSKEIEFVGLTNPISVKENTILLSFYFSVRKENRKLQDGEETYTEDQVLNNVENIVIEGDPGSGKTTTLKRIISHYFFSNHNKQSVFNYPVLVRFRAIDTRFNLYTYFCHLIGVSYETKFKEIKVEVTKQRIRKIDGEETIEFYKIEETREEEYFQVNNIDIEVFTAEVIEKNKVLLIMDGLDEIKPQLMSIFQKQIKELSLKLSEGKIMLTSRPNYINSIFPNFRVFEVKELDYEQMREISKLWLYNHEEFLKQLESKSYFELANRPLFLSFLIILFKEQSSNSIKILPISSQEVYVQIIELLVKKWDKERAIERVSKYAYFDPSKKLKFLSHLSFKLTYVIKEKIFSHKQLRKAYLQIHDKFGLPADEASQVAEEIENHTGIIVKSLYDKYEFSHLAIQEYLCAEYIVNAPFEDVISDYFTEYPAPLAVAVCLSSEPTSWFFQLVKKVIILSYDKRTENTSLLLDRLVVESPYFEKNPRLGIAVLLLCKFCDCRDKKFLSSIKRFIISNKNIVAAIEEVIKKYWYNRKKTDYLDEINLVVRNKDADSLYPETLVFPSELKNLIPCLIKA